MIRTGFVGLRPSLPEGSPNGRHWSLVAYQLRHFMQQQTQGNLAKEVVFLGGLPRLIEGILGERAQ
jgi:hypothetical protein